jgi:preprotein translocase subunit SecF
MSKTKYIFTSSLILVVVSIFIVFSKGFVFGVDFVGGTVVQVKYETKAPMQLIREKLKDTHFGNIEIQEFGSPEEITLKFQKTGADVASDVGDEIRQLLKDTGKFEIRKVDIIGPKIGKELVEKGIMAFIITVVGILIYVAVRFEYRFAIASIIALLHDIILTAGMVSLFKIEFDLTVLAAFLTLLGYSINDTIVIFDRIRETIQTMKESAKYNMNSIINDSVSKTMSRTILTVFTLFCVVLTLFLFGGEIIYGFSFAMLVGVLIGAYSSIFIASPFLVWFRFDVAKAKEKYSDRLRQQAQKERERAMYEKGIV